MESTHPVRTTLKDLLVVAAAGALGGAVAAPLRTIDFGSKGHDTRGGAEFLWTLFPGGEAEGGDNTVVDIQ